MHESILIEHLNLHFLATFLELICILNVTVEFFEKFQKWIKRLVISFGERLKSFLLNDLETSIKNPPISQGITSQELLIEQSERHLEFYNRSKILIDRISSTGVVDNFLVFNRNMFLSCSIYCLIFLLLSFFQYCIDYNYYNCVLLISFITLFYNINTAFISLINRIKRKGLYIFVLMCFSLVIGEILFQKKFDIEGNLVISNYDTYFIVVRIYRLVGI